MKTLFFCLLGVTLISLTSNATDIDYSNIGQYFSDVSKCELSSSIAGHKSAADIKATCDTFRKVNSDCTVKSEKDNRALFFGNTALDRKHYHWACNLAVKICKAPENNRPKYSPDARTKICESTMNQCLKSGRLTNSPWSAPFGVGPYCQPLQEMGYEKETGLGGTTTVLDTKQCMAYLTGKINNFLNQKYVDTDSAEYQADISCITGNLDNTVIEGATDAAEGSLGTAD